MTWLWRWLKRAASLPLALLILFEEWGWEPLQRAAAALARHLRLARLEAWIARLPPWGALAVFVLPSLALLPVKLAALALIAQGHAMLGVGVIVVAKLAGTAVLARLFTLTRSSLMQLAWFASLYTRWTTWKEALLAQVRASWAWRAGRVLKRNWRRALRRWFAGDDEAR